jgi:hypothetical protein
MLRADEARWSVTSEATLTMEESLVQPQSATVPIIRKPVRVSTASSFMTTMLEAASFIGDDAEEMSEVDTKWFDRGWRTASQATLDYSGHLTQAGSRYSAVDYSPIQTSKPPTSLRRPAAERFAEVPSDDINTVSSVAACLPASEDLKLCGRFHIWVPKIRSTRRISRRGRNEAFFSRYVR